METNISLLNLLPYVMTSTNNLLLIDLPWEDIIYRKILTKLELKDLFNLRCTSNKYKELVDSYLRTIQFINFYRNKINTAALQVLLQNCRCLRRINLSKCDFINLKEATILFKNNPLISDVNLSNSNKKPNCIQLFHAVTMNCKNLKKINLSGCIEVSLGAIDFFIYHQKDIQSLNLSNCCLLSENSINKLVIKFYSIKNLSLSGIPAVTDSVLVKISQHCKFLEFLNVDRCPVTSDAIKKLALNVPTLKSVRAFGKILHYEQ